MNKKYTNTLLALLLCSGSFAVAMEVQEAAEGNNRVKTLKNLSAAAVASKPSALAELCPDLTELVKEKLISDNLPYFLDVFSSCSFKPIEGMKNYLGPVALGMNGTLAVGGKNSESDVLVSNLTQNPPIHKRLTHFTYIVLLTAMDAHNRYALMTSFNDTQARLWDLQQNPPTCEILLGHARYKKAIAISRDARYALTGCDDGTLLLWTIGKPSTHIVLPGHTQVITAAAFSPDSTFAVTSAHDNTIRLWDLTGTPVTGRIIDDKRIAGNIAVTNDGKILVNSFDGTIAQYDIRQDPIKPKTLLANMPHRTIAFSPEGTHALMWTMHRVSIINLIKPNENVEQR